MNAATDTETATTDEIPHPAELQGGKEALDLPSSARSTVHSVQSPVHCHSLSYECVLF
jgi:hypothetical protein